MIKTILIISAAILIGYIIGLIQSYRKNRKQCLNCGSHNTYLVSWVLGGGGGNYHYAVKTWEYHCCKKCDGRITATFKLEKN